MFGLAIAVLNRAIRHTGNPGNHLSTPRGSLRGSEAIASKLPSTAGAVTSKPYQGSILGTIYETPHISTQHFHGDRGNASQMLHKSIPVVPDHELLLSVRKNT